MKWIEELIKLRNELYEDLPKGEISSWELLHLIKLHINDLDSFINRNSASLPQSSTEEEKELWEEVANVLYGFEMGRRFDMNELLSTYKLSKR